MGFFDRVVNLARGTVKSALKPGDPARAAALEAELARATPHRVVAPERTTPERTTPERTTPSISAPTAAPASGSPTEPGRAPPERDPSGEIKRTL